MNAEQALDAAFHAGLDARLFELVGDDLLHLGEEGFALLAAGVDGLLYLLVSEGIEETETQVFEFPANFAHSKAVRDWCVNFERLFGDFVLAIGWQMLQRAHVMQA